MPHLLSLFTDGLLRTVDQLSTQLQARIAPPSRARVVIVPALPGSELGRRVSGQDEIVWFDPESVREGRLVDLGYDAGGPSLEPLDVIQPVYLQMTLRLRLAGYEVVTHPYDWRRPVRDLGRELAEWIRAEGRDVHLVTHSFGGLVARAALLSGAPGVGEVVMLGTPNHGCFEVVQGIRGNHWVLRVLSAMDGQRSALELGRIAFGSWPSVYDTLPERLSPDDFDTFDAGAWPAEGLAPRAELLARAAEVKTWLAGATGRFHVIAGYGLPTIERAEVTDGVFQYRRSDDGDGFVTTRRAPLEGYPAYFTRCAHIGMPNHADVIDAVEDILDHGATSRLATSPPSPSSPSTITEAEPVEAPFGGRRGDMITADDLRQAFDEIAGFIAPLPFG